MSYPGPLPGLALGGRGWFSGENGLFYTLYLEKRGFLVHFLWAFTGGTKPVQVGPQACFPKKF